MEPVIACLGITPYSGTFSDAAKVAELASQIGVDGQDSWIICQSLAEDVYFEFYKGTLPESFEQSVAGRIFSPRGELRWLRVGSECRMWLTAEKVGEPRYRRRTRRYYLWGMNVRGTRNFFENRTPRSFYYPLPADSMPQADDRAFIEVVEYLAEPPANWLESPDEMERILNQPEIVAHRYLRVGCGRSSDEVNQ